MSGPAILNVDLDLGAEICQIALPDGSVLIVVKGIFGKPMFFRWNANLGVLETVTPVGRWV
jgi:hypothetical protein